MAYPSKQAIADLPSDHVLLLLDARSAMTSMEAEWGLAMQAVEAQLTELSKLLTQHAPQRTPMGVRRSARSAPRSTTRASAALRNQVGLGRASMFGDASPHLGARAGTISCIDIRQVLVAARQSLLAFRKKFGHHLSCIAPAWACSLPYGLMQACISLWLKIQLSPGCMPSSQLSNRALLHTTSLVLNA